MTLLNMKNVIYISSPNKLIVDKSSEYTIVYSRQALVTSVSMHVYIYY